MIAPQFRQDTPRRRTAEEVEADLAAGREAAERWLREITRRRRWWRRVCQPSRTGSAVARV